MPAQIHDWLNPALLVPIATSILRFGAILLIALFATRLLAKAIPKIQDRMVSSMTRRPENGQDLELEKRARTISGILIRTSAVIVWTIAIVMAMREAGFDIAPILAGAGIVGLAVGFGAQNLVRDVITGMFMLLENQLRVGDVAVINGTGGLVEEINLRTTVLRGIDGTLHVFSNGNIQSLSNKTHGFAYYVFDTGVSYEEDTDRVVVILREIAETLRKDPKFSEAMPEPLDVLGVDGFGDSAVVIKTRIKTTPMDQWRVGREMNRRIKKRFDEEGIEIPFPQRTLHVVRTGEREPSPAIAGD